MNKFSQNKWQLIACVCSITYNSRGKMKQSTRDLQREDPAADAAAGCTTSLSADRWSRKNKHHPSTDAIDF